MGYRSFNLKIVPNDRPNDDGRWVQRVVPDEWPGDDKAQAHMLRAVPDFNTEPMPGYHVVEIEETKPGPSDQPGSMREMAGLPASEYDLPQPGYGMR